MLKILKLEGDIVNMPRKTEELQRIRHERMMKGLCYDCGRKLLFLFWNHTRCRNCFKKERDREKRRIRMRDLFNLYKRRLINKPIDALGMYNLNGLNIMEKHSLIFSYWYNYEREKQ